MIYIFDKNRTKDKNPGCELTVYTRMPIIKGMTIENEV